MRATLLICAKDLKSRLRDRSALLIGIVVPLSLAFIFNAIFSGIGGNSTAIDLGVVNADGGAASAQFVSQVLGAVGRSGLIAIHREPTVARARMLAGNGTLQAVIIIPAGFSARVQSQRPASMQVIGNIDDPISAEIARSIAQSYAAELNRVRLSVTAVVAAEAGPAASGRRAGTALAPRAAAATPPVVVSDVSATSKQLDQKSFFAAGMAVFFVFFTVQFGVTSLLEERNNEPWPGWSPRRSAAPRSSAGNC